MPQSVPAADSPRLNPAKHTLSILCPVLAPDTSRTIKYILWIIPTFNRPQPPSNLSVKVRQVILIKPISLVHITPGIRRQILHRLRFYIRDIVVYGRYSGIACARSPTARDDVMDVGLAPGRINAAVGISCVAEDLAATDEDDVVACGLSGSAGSDAEHGTKRRGVTGESGAVKEAGAEGAAAGADGGDDSGERIVIRAVAGEFEVLGKDVEASVVVFGEFIKNWSEEGCCFSGSLVKVGNSVDETCVRG